MLLEKNQLFAQIEFNEEIVKIKCKHYAAFAI